MSINKELNDRIFLQTEKQQTHVEYQEEFGFYTNVAEGNIESVKKILANPDNTTLYDGAQYGKLSKNPLMNMRYHFVVSVALITRLCVEKGLDRELAYTMSDLYIGKMDLLQSPKQILSLHNEMLIDFTHKMSSLPKRQIYSIQVIKAIEYIYKYRNRRLTVQNVADFLGINRSYLSTLFKKETNISVSKFIRQEKIKAASNMLRFSDYSYSDISEYFGFASQSHFIKCFKEETGYTPTQYRKYFSHSEEMFK